MVSTWWLCFMHHRQAIFCYLLFHEYQSGPHMKLVCESIDIVLILIRLIMEFYIYLLQVTTNYARNKFVLRRATYTSCVNENLQVRKQCLPI